jgi:hypothetical protein
MRCLIFAFVLAGLIALPLAFSQQQPDDSLHISGSGIAASDWTVDQIQKQLASDVAPVTYRAHGQSHVFQCVPLISVLKAAGVATELKMNPNADPKTKSYSLRFVIAAVGRDGYTVAFSLAELVPDIGNRHVYVAFSEDGKPLSDQDGPLRLLSPDDQKPARSIHELAALTVINTATTQP